MTVVVLTWNNEHDTKACVDSLLVQDYAALKILIVDNASSDGSGQRLHARYPSADYVQADKNLGYCGGNNRGIKWAVDSGADYVLVINNDTVLDRTCVRELMLCAMREGDVRGREIGAVGAKILRYDAPDLIWFAGGEFDRLKAIGLHPGENLPDANPGETAPRDVSFLTGCCLLFPVSALREVGVFREDFFIYCEDVEWSLRAARHGLRLVYAPAAKLRHRVPPIGTPASPTNIRLRDRNRRRIVRLHYGAGAALKFALWFYPTRLALMVRYALRGEMDRARAIFKGMTES